MKDLIMSSPSPPLRLVHIKEIRGKKVYNEPEERGTCVQNFGGKICRKTAKE